MEMPYLVLTIVLAAIAAFSGVGKLCRDPRHRAGSSGVPLRYFPLLAACEIAGAVGLVLSIWWPVLGMAAGVGLVVYFVGAVVSHLRVGDMKGIGPAAFLLMVSVAALVLRVLMHKTGAAG